MHLINLPKLRMMELQTLAENSIKICASIEEVKPALQQVESALTTFKQGMLKDKTTGINKRYLDRSRDIAISGLSHALRAEKFFPYEDESKLKAVITLSTVVAKYTDVVRLSYDQETASIDNMLAEIKSLEVFPLLDDSITRWIPKIEALNEDFKAATSAFISSKATLNERDSATTLAPYLVSSLENLYTLLFAHSNISDNDAIKNAYSQITVLVEALN